MNTQQLINRNTNELAAIGGCLQNEQVLSDIITLLKPENFTNSNCRAYFETMIAMSEAGKKIDVVTVHDYGNYALDELFECVNNCATVHNAIHYAENVLKASQERQVIGVAETIKLIATGSLSLKEKLEKISDQLLNLPIETGSNSTGTSELINDTLKKTLAALNERIENDGEMNGLPTGLTDLDKRINGLRPATLTLIAGRPAMGKTVLAMNIAETNAINGKNVLFFSLEMSGVELCERAISSVGNADYGKIRNADLNNNDWDAITKGMSPLSRANMYIFDNPYCSISRIKSEAKRVAVKAKGLDLIVIDYIQLMEDGDSFDGLTKISRNLKLLSKELNCPVIALSQLSRSVEQRDEKRPKLSDLRGSGALEQDADIILFPYRDVYYDEHSKWKNIAEIITGKGRSLETGTDYAVFKGINQKFVDADLDEVYRIQQQETQVKPMKRGF